METVLQYNKVWALLVTIGILVLLDYLGLELPLVVEAAAMLFSVERTPNGRVPLQTSNDTATL